MENPQEWSLFIDIDGTLLGVAPTPDAVSVPKGLVTVLDAVARGFGGAVALLTGRRVADADRLFAPLKLVAAGVHGTELRLERNGPVEMLAPAASPGVVQAINDISCVADGVLIEQKGAGIAVHYRNAPHVRATLIAELKRIVAQASDGLALRRGRMVVEVLPKPFSKGTALTRLAGLPPFSGRRPIMIGDDAGDESALVAAERLGGLGLRVAGEHFGRTVADFDGVASVRAWLASLARRMEERDQPQSA